MDEKVGGKLGFYAIISSIGCLPLFLIGFTLFVVVLFIAGLFEGTGGSGANGAVYNSECNYEETMVTVMDGSNTEVLATVTLEDYIIGVACVEIGACGGASATLDEDYVKAQYIASKTYVLSSRGYDTNTKSITVRASTRNQQWCDLKTGCFMTKESDTIYHNSYPGDYDKSKAKGKVYGSRSFTEEDLEIFHKYYQDTYGDLFLSSEYNSVVKSLGSDTAVYYKASTQDFWRNEANNGTTYGNILKATATSGASDSEYYAGKSIYKLGSYCESRSTHNSNVDYVAWMIDIANDDTHGYSQPRRTFNPDIDCSSFVYYALLNNGYTTQQLGGTWPFTTRSMGNILKKLGFKELKFDINSLEAGDILWREGHTEVYIGDGKRVGAHWNYDGKTGDGKGNEVDVSTMGNNWTLVYRKS